MAIEIKCFWANCSMISEEKHLIKVSLLKNIEQVNTKK